MLYLLATAMFSLGVWILVVDAHVVGTHSLWNKAIGVCLMMTSMCAMFPIQMAGALKMLAPLVFGWRKGEVPPPEGVAPGTPVDAVVNKKPTDDTELRG